eukprot:gnl/MRDRNA2_/MRDRNA2_100727_c0_seq1.p1 gnl/MRDRNA2_/MRDRNA2_100727_c0~~gnl/MRDRNA2_/MRDRNA2_100727_c0_seq1.p1  ORF type:complete len:183 (+),score=36.53 gnl/MRDRNA2_/MRDRNA2_100727_c0_seq1:100-648(+)
MVGNGVLWIVVAGQTLAIRTCLRGLPTGCWNAIKHFKDSIFQLRVNDMVLVSPRKQNKRISQQDIAHDSHIQMLERKVQERKRILASLNAEIEGVRSKLTTRQSYSSHRADGEALIYEQQAQAADKLLELMETESKDLQGEMLRKQVMASWIAQENELLRHVEQGFRGVVQGSNGQVCSGEQ